MRSTATADVVVVVVVVVIIESIIVSKDFAVVLSVPGSPLRFSVTILVSTVTTLLLLSIPVCYLPWP